MENRKKNSRGHAFHFVVSSLNIYNDVLYIRHVNNAHICSFLFQERPKKKYDNDEDESSCHCSLSGGVVVVDNVEDSIITGKH